MNNLKKNGMSPSEPKTHSAQGPLAPDRVLEVLRLLGRETAGWTLTELSRELGLPKSSLFNILRSLKNGGYLIRGGNRRFLLGPAAFTFAAEILSNRELPALASQFMEELAEKSGETVLLGSLANDAPVAMYIDKVESKNPIRYTVGLGERRELYCSAVGKLVLAYQPEEWREQYITTVEATAYLSNTIVDKDHLRREVAKVRHCGYATTVDERVLGASAVAAPIFDRKDRFAAGLILAGPTPRLLRHQSHFISMVKESALTISKMVGYRPQPDNNGTMSKGESGGEKRRE